MELNPRPLIALLPLGTGNDLARTLGYGADSDGMDARQILERIRNHTEETTLDRWRVDLFPLQWKGKKLNRAKKASKSIFIQNYLGIG